MECGGGLHVPKDDARASALTGMWEATACGVPDQTTSR